MKYRKMKKSRETTHKQKNNNKYVTISSIVVLFFSFLFSSIVQNAIKIKIKYKRLKKL